MIEVGKKIGVDGAITSLPRISKILLIIRNDADYEKATRTAIRIAKGNDAIIYVLYAVDMEVPPVVPENVERELFARLRREGKNIVDACIKQIRSAGIDAEFLDMHFGFAAERILRAERELNPDLIVMCIRGLSMFKKILLGSVSERVAKEAKAPILLVK